ncbi:MAG: hypothetical protein DMF63_01455 [Acidobacteria bacterium]|nr:MAG: hypothetical protein DMF63_01455 [Acidobacteriota bacterium]
MKRYRVEFSDTAESELVDSIIWGVTNWGKEPTFRWARNLRQKVTTLLAANPLAHPLAPESKWASVEVRQLIVGRYRVLFEIRGKTVNILHITGPFIESADRDIDG